MVKYAWGILSIFIIHVGICAAQPVAGFRADTLRGCAPVIVSFTDESLNAVSWSWDLGNGNSNIQNPITAYSQAGLYTIQLIVTDNLGNRDTLTRENYIDILPVPEVEFSFERQADCGIGKFQFENNSTTATAITSYSWDFGDGAPSSESNPFHIFTLGGNYPISLFIETEAGCKAFANDTLQVELYELNADFTADSLSSCAPPLNVQFGSVADAGLTHLWDFGDGTTSTLADPSHTFTDLGIFSITHIVTDPFGCKDTISRNKYVRVGSDKLSISSDTDSICLGGPMSFTAQSSSVSGTIVWDMGDGTPPRSGSSFLHTFPNPGTFQVLATLDDGQGCLSVSTLSITVHPLPEASFSFTYEGSSCKPPYNVRFQDESTDIVQWLWEFGDGSSSTLPNPTHTYQDEETNPVSLLVTSNLGCLSAASAKDTVKTPFLKALLTADRKGGCVPLDITLSDSSENVVGNASYSWTVAGFPQGNDPSYSITLTDTGWYDVQLIVEDGQGCKDTALVKDYISAGTLPIPDFEPTEDSVCVNTDVLFTNLSSHGDRFIWFFSSGGSVEIFEPIIEFRESGELDVVLLAIDKGCRADTSKTAVLYVNPPVADFSASQTAICKLPTEVFFTNESLGATRFKWEMGNGVVLTDEDVSLTITQPGEYPIILTAYNDSFNCESVFTLPVNALPAKADFSIPDSFVCAPYSMNPVNESDPATTWIWDFGEGFLRLEENPTYPYQHAGLYTIGLQVENEIGCRDTLVRENTLRIYKPQTIFSAVDTTVGCLPLEVTFQDMSITQTPISSYEWYMDDSTFYSVPTPTHTFTEPGYYDVELTVRDSMGCNQRVIKSNYIFATQPIPSFEVPFPTNCPDNTVLFLNRSEGFGLSYEWNFGDGNTSTLESPSHIYEQVGDYSVGLQLTDVNGCDTTLLINDAVSVAPFELDFTADTTFTECPPLMVTFSTDTVAGHPNTSWNWDLGTGATSILPTAQHLYSWPGEYDVELIGLSLSGCRDTITKEKFITVKGPVGSFSYSPFEGCPGLEVQFEAVVDTGISLQWLTGDGIFLPGDSTTYTYLSSGTFTPIMTLTDSAGCATLLPSDTTVTIHPSPAVSIQSSDTLACTGVEVTFQVPDIQPAPLQAWDWKLGDTSATSSTPSTSFKEDGFYEINVIVENVFGCVDSAMQALEIQIIEDIVPEIPLIEKVSVISENEISIDFQSNDLPPIYDGNYSLLRENTLGIFDPLTTEAIGTRNRFIDREVQSSAQPYCYVIQLETICGTTSAIEDSTKHCTIDLTNLPDIDQILVQWTPYQGWDSINTYKLYRSPKGADWVNRLIAELPGSQTSFIDTTTYCDQAYSYTLQAISSTGLISKADTTIGYAYLNPPTAETHMINATVVDNETVQIEWEIPAIDRWEDLIVEKSSGGGFALLFTQSSSDPSAKYLDTRVDVRNKAYTYRIFGRDSCGNITPLGRTANSIRLEAQQNQGQISLNWNTYKGWKNGVQEFRVERYLASQGIFEEIATLSATSQSYEDTTKLLKSPDVCYRVWAYEEGGNKTASLSNESCLTPYPVLFTANAFSPNGDGKNDEYLFSGAYLEQFTIQIFNRWGELVYQGSEADTGWNGTLPDGSLAPPATYMFHIQSTSQEGLKFQKVGSIQLIR
ncbi:MAG: PKD domain-containing protein [Bacteroidota bacterium]